MTGYESKRAAAQAKVEGPIHVVCQCDKCKAQPEQEPMLLIQSHRDGFWCVDLTCKKCYGADFRFKHVPQQRPWVGLTDEDCKNMSEGDRAFVMWVEAKLKQKNGYAEEKNT